MSVIIFCNTLKGISGLDKSMIETANLLSSEGHDVHLFSIVGKTDGFQEATPQIPLSLDVKLYSLKSLVDNTEHKYRSRMFRAFEVEQEFLKSKFSDHDVNVIAEMDSMLGSEDSIIFTHPLQSLLYSHIEKPSKAKKIIQIHGNYLDELHNLELLMESKHVIDYIQVVAPSMIDALAHALDFDKGSILFIPNIHLSREIGKVSSGDKEKIVSIVGSLQPRKNQIDAIKMMAHLSNDIKLYIWGGFNSAYGKSLQAYVRKAGLEDRVIFKGNGTEEEIYRVTSITVMTSRSEGFSYIMPESASHGIPMVLYDFDYGPRDFVKDGINGYIVPCGEYGLLADRVQKLFDDEDLRKRFGLRSLEKYERELSTKKIYSGYLSLINSPDSRRLDFTNLLRTNVASSNLTVDTYKPKFHRRPFGKSYFSAHYRLSTNGNSLAVLEAIAYKRKGILKAPVASANGALTFSIGPLRPDGGVPEKYVLYLRREDGELEYLTNTKLRGGTEFNQEYMRGYDHLPKEANLNEVDHILGINGLNIRFPSYEIVRSVVNELGDPLIYKTGYSLYNGCRQPSLNITGEFREIHITMNSGYQTRIRVPQISYRELFERLDGIESEYDLADYKVQGVFAWELIKAPITDLLMEFHGLWGRLIAKAQPVDRSYGGSKKLSDIESGDRLLLEFCRKRGEIEDSKTLMFQTSSSAVIEFPDSYGYSLRSYDHNSNVYPVDECLRYQDNRFTKRVNRYFSSDLEEIFKKEFGVNIDFKTMINFRVNKYLYEHEYWKSFFSMRRFEEVIIPSAYWFPGIVRAAKDAGIKTSDVQYAMISPLHPNYGYKTRMHYTTDNIYTWSDFWINERLPYAKTTVLPENRMHAHLSSEAEVDIDVTIASQTRLKGSFQRFTRDLSLTQPQLRVVYAAHPDDDREAVAKYFADSGCANVEVSTASSLDCFKTSKVVVGAYSTALYEAAAIGCHVLVLPLPGYEIVAREIDSGVFSLIDDVNAVVESVSSYAGRNSKDFIFSSSSLQEAAKPLNASSKKCEPAYNFAQWRRGDVCGADGKQK